jgi:hypothetical protein
VAELAGIPEHSFAQMWKYTEKFEEKFNEFGKRQAESGFDPEAFAKKSVKLQDSLAGLGVSLLAMKDNFYSGFIDPAQASVEWLDKLTRAVNKSDWELVGKIIDVPALLNKGVRDVLPQAGVDYLDKMHKEEPRPGSFWDRRRKEREAASGALAPRASDLSRQAGAPESGISVSDRAVISMIESGGRANARTGRYKGKNMLSDEEFGKYGGGDIYNAADNDRAAGAALEAHKAAFRRRHDRNPTLTELYMMHQQGEGGAEAHMAHPERPAWLNMYSTAEGRKRGPEWARKAIWGNLPSDMKGRFGGAASITSQEFMDMWHEKIDRFSARLGGGRGRPPRTEPTDERGQADSSAKNDHAESPGIVQNNNFTVHMNGITEPDKVRDAMRGGALDWASLSSGWLVKAGDTMR